MITRVMLVVVGLALPLSALDKKDQVQRLAVGQPMPALTGEYLTGRKAVLPEAAKGKTALLALGFTYDSRFAVEAWVARFRKEFWRSQHLTFYEIPMIGGMARMGRWFIDGGMRRCTPKDLHENVVTVYGGTDPWKRRVAFKNEDDAYLVLLGQVVADRELTVDYHGGGEQEAEQHLETEHDVGQRPE